MTAGRQLGQLTWPEVADRRPGLLVVPLGSTEQHGPHLPFDTDTCIATALADGLSAHRSDVVVAPPLVYGSSGEHADFPGTLSIGAEVLERVVVELVRSADHWAGVVLVCGHAGNWEPVRRANGLLEREGRRVLAWRAHIPGGDAHAGHTETSLMLVLERDSVRRDRAEMGEVRPIDDLMPLLRARGVKAAAPNGVLGDPTTASVAEGQAVFDRLLGDLCAAVEAWCGPCAEHSAPGSSSLHPDT